MGQSRAQKLDFKQWKSFPRNPEKLRGYVQNRRLKSTNCLISLPKKSNKIQEIKPEMGGEKMLDKNGANRGGARPGAGRKKKPLTERIEAGQKATILKAPEIDAPEMPKIKDYFKAEQRMGELYAAEIYQETWDWLNERGCATLINPMLLEQYAMSAARWVQLEGINSQYGFISKTAQGNAAASPFVTQALAYMKQTDQLWYQIYQIVRENCSTTFEGTPQDDLMERLLRARDGENGTGG